MTMAPQARKRNTLPKEILKQKLKERGQISKKLLKKKRARLIVKNLSFKVNKDILKKHFEQFGEVEEVELLEKSGKLMGCGFVQFKLVQKAAKAKHYTDGRPLLGREISVDFAKPKNKYNKERKIQAVVENSVIIPVKVKGESDKSLQHDLTNRTGAQNDICVDGEEENSNSSCNYQQSDEASESEVEGPEDNRKPRFYSHDISEGKTIFIKNLPFDATKDDLKQCMLQYGPVYYALVCVDKLTEHSKGTAFVKFVEKEDANKALHAGTELTLLGNILDCHPAIDQSEMKAKKKSEPKDSRNLYLVKEGVVLAGSGAAEGLSAADMAKRLQVEQYKTQMLKKLNMFVSKDRLVAHNLPSTWDDTKLRTLFQKYGGPGAVVKEARVMRDMKNIDANGMGRSKEYGFVSFTKHEHALVALRNLNNNPDIFSASRRPIISFSIENKSILKAKLKRLEKSRVNNFSKRKPYLASEKRDDRNKLFPKSIRKRRQDNVKQNTISTENVPEFSGVTSQPGTVQKMRSNYKLTAQAKLHYDNLKKEKRKRKNAVKTLSEKKKEFIRQPKQKMNKRKESDNFSKMVNDYKQKLTGAESFKTTKWYK